MAVAIHTNKSVSTGTRGSALKLSFNFQVHSRASSYGFPVVVHSIRTVLMMTCMQRAKAFPFVLSVDFDVTTRHPNHPIVGVSLYIGGRKRNPFRSGSLLLWPSV